jgi:signal transduction histidine kinase/DNA-binding response OmpR family regulator/HPt (histidine-containing phosphotransfer) domain-containing protein
VSAETGRINPRKSFETWLQLMQGQSRPWDAGERATAIEAGRLVTRLLFEDQEARRHELEQQTNRLLSERANALEALSEELRHAKETAEAASLAKGQFLANMSHEIRTPMNAVLGFAHLLQNLALDPAERDMVRKIQNAGRSLLSIINNILDFSKIEAGGLDIEQAPFQLGDVLNNVAAIMGSAAGEKDIELIVGAMPVGAEFLIGDAMRLEQVLVNLVGNAIKFTEAGEVVLTVSLTEAEAGQKKLCFAVRDTGMGIAAEKQKVVFSAFSQADGSTARQFGGTGLGLTITKRLVNLMGGRMSLVSVPGEGSTFSFGVPLRIDPQSGLSAPCFPQGQRMLIADDHPVALHMLAEIARGMGWSVTTASSGEEAVAQAIAAANAGFPFESLLLDWKMPGADGLAAAGQIKAELGERRPPVILMIKAQDREQLMQHPRSGVADAVLAKPVTASAMSDAVSRAIAERSGQEEMTASPNQSRLAGLCILVVDDSEINREVAGQILEREGAEVMLAADGVQVLDQLRTTPRRVDIVLMDVQMPVMDGYEATRRIREDLLLVDLPVVALTAGVFSSQQQAALGAGMNGFIPKPFDVNELIGAVLRFTGRQPAATVPTGKSAIAPPLIAVELIDMEAALRNWGDAASYHKYLRLFAATHGRDAEDVGRLLADERLLDAIALAHKLKGVAGSLALTKVWRHADALEQKLKNARGWEQDLGELRAALHSTLAAIAVCIERGENSAEARPVMAPLDAISAPRLFDGLLRALDRDNLDEAEALLDGLADKLSADLLSALRNMLDAFDFRGAEALALAACGAIAKETRK